MAKSNWFYFILVGFILFIFLFLRLFRIDSSLLFFNDMGRDFLELYEWQQTKLPPLLGPQTSALSFNQSPVYYYLFFPAYLLTHHSPYSTLITLIIIYLACFSFGSIYSFKNIQYRQRFLVISLLIAIHPQILIQNRFIWNPSFLPLFISLALFVYPELLTKITPKRLHLFVIGLTLAISFNLSAIPLSLAAIIYGAYFWRRQTIKVIIWFTAYLAIWYLPVIFFELRHHFALTYLLIHGQRLGVQNLSIYSKVITLTQFILAIPNLLTIAFGMVLGFGLYFWQKLKTKDNALLHYTSLFSLTLGITLLLPSAVLAHYIFGLLISLFFIIASLSLPYALSLITLLVLYWYRPVSLVGLYPPARRTVKDTQTCFQNFCQTHPEPLYVSVQAGFHPYHNGPEHRYFMLESGCNVQKIESSDTAANLMAVVVDDSTYEHGKTAYNELTLFGPSVEKEIITCQPNLKIHLLEKTP